MAQQTINVGTAPNDGTGTPLRTAFQYTNSNFSELYTALGGGSGLPGASTQVLFNNGTNIAGDAGLVYNSTTDALTIGGNVQAASATITGDLTVRTNKLAVTSTGVGCGTTTPATSLEVWKDLIRVTSDVTSGVYGTQFWRSGVERGRYGFDFSASLLETQSDGDTRFLTGGETERYRIDSTGIATWSNVGGVAGTAMTLNATGLGVGIAPDATKSTRLSVYQTGDLTDETAPLSVGNTAAGGMRLYAGVNNTNEYVYIGSVKSGTGYRSLILQPNGGNLGIGVTPTIAKVQTNGAFATTGAVGSISTTPLANALIGDFNTTCRLIATGPNTTTAGVHKFINASSDASVYLETMTLDALGNVIIRSPATPATLTTNGQLTVNATSDTNLRFSYRGSDGVTRVANITLA